MEIIRYKMRPMAVNTIEININLEHIDVQSIEVYSINDNSEDILLENNVDYKFDYINNKTFLLVFKLDIKLVKIKINLKI